MTDLRDKLNRFVQEKVEAQQRIEAEKLRVNRENYSALQTRIEEAEQIDSFLSRITDEVNSSDVAALGYQLSKEGSMSAMRQQMSRYERLLANPKGVIPADFSMSFTLLLNHPSQESLRNLPLNHPQRSALRHFRVVYYGASNSIRITTQPPGSIKDAPFATALTEIEQSLFDFLSAQIK